MAEDIATLGIVVDATDADGAGVKLENLAQKAERTEAATKSLGAASKVLQTEVAKLASTASNAGSGVKTFSNAMDEARGKSAGASAATDELADRINRLKASVDPVGVAISKVNDEMREARQLYAQGAISASDYAQAHQTLMMRADSFAKKQASMNAAMVATAGGSKLAAHEVLNLSRQFADIGVTAAMGMSPLMILIQQGPQIADIMQTSGLGFKGMAIEAGKFLKILKTVPAEAAGISTVATASEAASAAIAASNATAAASAATAATAQAAIVGSAEAAAAAETQLAFSFGAEAEAAVAAASADGVAAAANEAVAATAAAAAKAESQLSFAFMETIAGAQGATAAAAELSAANEGIAATAETAAAAESVALAPLGVILAGLALAAGVFASAFAIGAHEINESNKGIVDGLDLTDKQLKKLKDSGTDTAVTMGDTFKATFQVIGERLVSAFDGPLKWLANAFNATIDFVKNVTVTGIKVIGGGFLGAFYTIKATWALLPAAIGDMAVTAANATLGAIEWMINKVIGGINAVKDFANSASEAVGFGKVFGDISPVQLKRVENQWAGAARNVANIAATEMKRGMSDFSASFDGLLSDIAARAVKNALERIKAAAGEAEKGRDPKAKKEGKSDAEKEFEKQLKAALDFIKALKTETAEIGKNRVEIKMMAIERAALAATTVGLADEIRALGKAWLDAENQFQTDQMKQALDDQAKQIEFENSLIGMNAEQRAVANVERELELRLIKAKRDGYTIDTAQFEAEKQHLITLAAAKGKLEDNVTAATKYADEMTRIANSTRDASNAIGDYFGKAIGGFTRLASVFTDYAAKKADVQKTLAEELEKAGTSTIKIEEAQQKAAEKTAELERNKYADMLGAAKTFFNEHSKGYKILEGAEKAYRAYQMAMSIKTMVQDGVETVKTILNATARATAKGAEGIATQAKLPFPANIAAMAATAAALVAAGIAVLGGGGGGGGKSSIPTSEDIQKQQSTGTVLGDATAHSESITKSLELALANSNKDLEYSNQMVRYLRSINDNIGSLSSLIARQLNAGGALDSSSLNLGTNSSNGMFGGIPVLGGLLGGLLGKKTVTTSLNDQGIDFGSGNVGSIIANGITANLYQEVLKTVKKSSLFGLSKSTKTTTDTYNTAADSDLTKQVQLLVGNLKSTLVEAAGTIGIDGASAMLDGFQIAIGKISFKDMSGEEIEAAIQAAFSTLGDDMAEFVYGDIGKFQKVGEGAMETLIRLAREFQVVDTTLKSIGMTVGAVGVSSIEARDRLVSLLGGVDDFVEKTNFFADNFLSQAEQMAPITASVRAEMERLGLANVQTKDQFKAVVQSLNLSTQSGAELYAALMNVAPAFAKTADYATKMATDIQAGLEKAVADAQKNLDDATGAVNTARGVLQTSYNEALATINSAVDEADKAVEAAAQQVEDARGSLQASYDAQLASINATADTATNAAEAAASQIEGAKNILKSAYDAAVDAINSIVDIALQAAENASAAADQARSNLRASYEATVSTINATASVARQAADASAEQINTASDALRNSYQTALDNIGSGIDAAQQVADAAEARVGSARDMLQSAYDASAQAIQDSIKSFDDAANVAAQNLDKARGVLQNAYSKAIADAQATLQEANSRAASYANNLQRIYDSSASDIEKRIADAESAVEAARKDLADAQNNALDEINKVSLQAYKDQADALSTSVDKLRGFVEALNEFNNELSGTELAQLSPEAAYTKAKADFASVSARAAGGDQDAIGELANVGKAFLDASKSYNASSKGYFDDLASVKSAVEGTLGATQAQLNSQEAQLNALNNIIASMQNVADNTLTVAEATTALQAAEAEAARVRAQGQAELAQLGAQLGAYVQIGQNSLDIQSNIAGLLKAQADARTAQTQVELLQEQLAAATGASETLTDIAGATAAYNAAFAANTDAKAAAAQARADAQSQLDALNQQVSGLLDVKTGVLDVGTAIDQLNGAIGESSAANAAVIAAKDEAAKQTELLQTQVSQFIELTDTTKSVDEAITDLQTAIANNESLNSAADQAEADAAAQIALLTSQVSGFIELNETAKSFDEALNAMKDAVATEATAQAAVDQARADAAAQIEALNAQVGEFLELNETTKSVEEALIGMRDAVATNETAQAAAEQARADAAAQIALLDAQVSGLLAANDNVKSVEQAISDMRSAVATNETAVLAAENARINAATQIGLLNKQVEGLLDIKTATVSVATAVADLKTAITAQTAAQKNYSDAVNNLTQHNEEVTQTPSTPVAPTPVPVVITPAPAAANDPVVERLDAVVTEVRANNVLVQEEARQSRENFRNLSDDFGRFQRQFTAIP